MDQRKLMDNANTITDMAKVSRLFRVIFVTFTPVAFIRQLYLQIKIIKFPRRTSSSLKYWDLENASPKRYCSVIHLSSSE